jgi:hypothetical protein
VERSLLIRSGTYGRIHMRVYVDDRHDDLDAGQPIDESDVLDLLYA